MKVNIERYIFLNCKIQYIVKVLKESENLENSSRDTMKIKTYLFRETVQKPSGDVFLRAHLQDIKLNMSNRISD